MILKKLGSHKKIILALFFALFFFSLNAQICSDPCEMVRNGSFDNSVPIPNYLTEYECGPLENCSCWFQFCSTADYFGQEETPPANNCPIPYKLVPDVNGVLETTMMAIDPDPETNDPDEFDIKISPFSTNNENMIGFRVGALIDTISPAQPEHNLEAIVEISEIEEAIYSQLNTPLLPNTTYSISLNTRIAVVDPSITNPTITDAEFDLIVFAFNSNYVIPGSMPDFFNEIDPNIIILGTISSADLHTIPTSNFGWNNFTMNYTSPSTLPNNFDRIGISGRVPTPVTQSGLGYLFIDNFQMSMLGVNITYNLPTIACLGDDMGDLSQYIIGDHDPATISSVTFTSTSNGLINNNGVYSFDPELAGIGSHEISATVTQTSGCVLEFSSTIDVVNCCQLSASIAVIRQPSCDKIHNGSLSINATGGVGQITYLWSNGESSQTINDLEIGNYNCIVTDQNGCTFTASINLTSSNGGPNIDLPLLPSPAVPTTYSWTPATFAGNAEFNTNTTLIVNPNVHLILDGVTIHFNSINSVEVLSGSGTQKGGRFSLMNSVLTSACDKYWQGIHVLGVVNTATYAPNEYKSGFFDSYYSTIENALVGVANFVPSLYETGMTTSYGGGIFCYKTIFHNNRRDVDMRNCAIPNNPGYGPGTFIFCDFILDQLPLSIPSGQNNRRLRFINIADAHLLACKIINTSTDYTNDSYNFFGVDAASSTVVINGCAEENGVQVCRGEISNMIYGVRSIGQITTAATPVMRGLGVLNTEINTLIGITGTDLPQAVITDNEIKLMPTSFTIPGPWNASSTWGSVGIQLNNSSANFNGTLTTIADNIINLNKQAHAASQGIIVDDCGWFDNLVYKNKIDACSQGLVLRDRNRFNVSKYSPGLRFECNNFKNNNSDILIQGNSTIGTNILGPGGSQGDFENSQNPTPGTGGASNDFTASYVTLSCDNINAVPLSNQVLGAVDYNWKSIDVNNPGVPEFCSVTPFLVSSAGLCPDYPQVGLDENFPLNTLLARLNDLNNQIFIAKSKENDFVNGSSFKLNDLIMKRGKLLRETKSHLLLSKISYSPETLDQLSFDGNISLSELLYKAKDLFHGFKFDEAIKLLESSNALYELSNEDKEGIDKQIAFMLIEKEIIKNRKVEQDQKKILDSYTKIGNTSEKSGAESLLFIYDDCESNAFHSDKIENENENEFSMNDFNFTISPNPAQTNIHVALNAKAGTAFTIRVFNALGTLIHSGNTYGNTVEINCTNWTDGIYLIEVIDANNMRQLQKVTIQK